MTAISQRKLLLAPALKHGDRVGVAAPAGPAEEAKILKGLEKIKAMGLVPQFSPDIFLEKSFLAGPDEARAKVLNDLFSDATIKAIFCTRGGYGAMRILDRLDYEAVRANPKPVIGFSDISALLLSLLKKTGLVTFYGPVVSSMRYTDDTSLEHLENMFFGRSVFPLSLDDFEDIKIIKPGRAKGPLLGGNLTLITALLGTGKLPAFDGAVLFLEDTGEAPYRLDRMMTTLKLSGILDSCTGVILGRFDGTDTEEEGCRVMEENLMDFNGPVISGFPIGHGPDNITLPLGPQAVLDTDKLLLDVTESYLV